MELSCKNIACQDITTTPLVKVSNQIILVMKWHGFLAIMLLFQSVNVILMVQPSWNVKTMANALAKMDLRVKNVIPVKWDSQVANVMLANQISLVNFVMLANQNTSIIQHVKVFLSKLVSKKSTLSSFYFRV